MVYIFDVVYLRMDCLNLFIDVYYLDYIYDYDHIRNFKSILNDKINGTKCVGRPGKNMRKQCIREEAKTT